jgi:hypothetical protein
MARSSTTHSAAEFPQRKPSHEPGRFDRGQGSSPVGQGATHASLRLANSSLATPQEYQVAQVFVEAEEYGFHRGELLAEVLRQGAGREDENRRQLAELDASFALRLGSNRELFAGEPTAISALVSETRVTQDRAAYHALKSRYFELGVELGESQGRHVDTEGFQRAARRLEALDRRTAEGVGAQRQDKDGDAETRQSSSTIRIELMKALRAASSQGERVGIDKRINAEIDAAELYRTIAGWKERLPKWCPFFKSFHVAHSILAGKSEKQLRFIDASMTERRGGGLREALVHAYGKRYERRIDWLVRGDHVGSLATQAARGIRELLSTRHSRGEGLRSVYEQIPAESLGRFERLFAQELGIPQASLHEYVAARVTEKTAHKLSALRKKDFMLERILHVEDLIESKHTQQLELRTILGKMAPSEVEPFCARYKEHFGRDLRNEIATKLSDSPARDLCLAVLDQHAERIMAAKVRCAFMYRADFIAGPFLNTTSEEREQTRRAYEKYYCDGRPELFLHLRQASWREDYFFLSKIPPLARMLEHLHWPCMNSYPFLESIVLSGGLLPAELLRYFMVGMGTDIKGIYAVLSNCTKAEIEAIEAEYAQRYTPGKIVRVLAKLPFVRDRILIGDLRHDLKVELSGDHEFDITLFMEGLPEWSDEQLMCRTLLDRLERRFQHEQSGQLMRHGLLSYLRGDGRVCEQFEGDFLNATRYYNDNIRSASKLSADQIKRFSTLVRLAEAQADAYREAKVAVSTLVLNSGAAIGATVGLMCAVKISVLPWWSGPIAAGLGSWAWRWVQGRLVLGKGFGTTDATFQALRAIADGASALTIKLGVATLSGLLGRQLSSAAAKGGVKSTLQRFIKTFEDGIKRQNKARHVLEQGSVLDSDAELEALSAGFYREIEANPGALSMELLTGERSVEDVICGALG